jgi:glycosyltransferase involved in cell wall biosynthesis
MKINELTSLTIAMPVFNEESGIEGWVTSIFSTFQEFSPTVIVVNDASTDGTSRIIKQLIGHNVKLFLIENKQNMGHGPSTIAGLKKALLQESNYVLSIDGDGGVDLNSLKNLVSIAIEQNTEVLEGVRRKRQDPIYRKALSYCVRILVGLRCGRIPKDGNTPIRIYQTDSLRKLVVKLPENSQIPNIHLSALIRLSRLKVEEKIVNCEQMGELVKQGSTWRNTRKLIPNRKFLIFCFRALQEWAFFKP